MTRRIRIHFSKRGPAVFVPHVDLPILFTRAARRAGIVMEHTQGFTPRPKTAFGPPLPVGVTGVSEPAEFWFSEWSGELQAKWGASLPAGFAIAGAREASGEALAKLCRDASYIIRPLNGASLRGMADAIGEDFGASGLLLGIRAENDMLAVSVTDPEKSGVSRMVKTLVSAGLIPGWRGIAAERAAVGRWDGLKVIPLSEEISS